jgi:GT2 family glycosyltransferase
MKVAVLITCFNRKEKTLSCIESIYAQVCNQTLELDVFLVDDGSTDGTSDAVQKLYPNVNLIKGSGSLFWARGMRLAWTQAMNSAQYDYYWLVNDDTTLYSTALSMLLEADSYAVSVYGVQGVYSGSTKSPTSGAHSYGGESLLDRKTYASCPVFPNGTYQLCDFTNANCLLVPESVVKKIGIFSEVYVQSIADYDYSMRAVTAKLPVLILPEYAGTCEYDHVRYEEDSIPTFWERWKRLFEPKGYSYHEFLHFVKLYFPKAYLKTIVTLWFRTVFPRIWRKMKA